MVEITGTVSAWDYRTPEEIAVYKARVAAEEEAFGLQRPRYEAFLLGLTELTRKYGIAVDSCGCCNSISLQPAKPEGEYCAGDGEFSGLYWTELLGDRWD